MEIPMKIGVIYPQIEMKGDPEAVRRFGLAAEQLRDVLAASVRRGVGGD